MRADTYCDVAPSRVDGEEHQVGTLGSQEMSDSPEFATPARAETARPDGGEHPVIHSVPLLGSAVPPAPSRRRSDADADADSMPQYRRNGSIADQIEAPA